MGISSCPTGLPSTFDYDAHAEDRRRQCTLPPDAGAASAGPGAEKPGKCALCCEFTGVLNMRAVKN